MTFRDAAKAIEAGADDDGNRILMWRKWHLRDCVWLDDANGHDFVVRRFKARSVALDG